MHTVIYAAQTAKGCSSLILYTYTPIFIFTIIHRNEILITPRRHTTNLAMSASMYLSSVTPLKSVPNNITFL